MKIYLFFKQYYIIMWSNIALFLQKKWVTPNLASWYSLVVIFPMFFFLYKFTHNIFIFFFILFFAINIKLILNAIDWIIARNTWINTKVWMFLNVWTDIWPDVYIIFLIFLKIGVNENLINLIIGIILIYLLLEYLFIFLFNKQNLFFWKDLRTFFYIFIFIVFYFELDFNYLFYYYFIILFIHNVWFFIKKCRN